MQVHFQRANDYEDSDEDGDNFLRVIFFDDDDDENEKPDIASQ